MSDLALLSVTEAADAFAKGEATAEAMVRACLARIDAFDAEVNSVVRLDREEALAAAAAQDKARAAGAALGPLAGVPMMHKDMYYRAGRVSTCGSAIRRDFVPSVTATVLRRLDAAGAIDMGTLNMAEFAQNPTGHNAHHGDCHNPWNLPYCTGGSSSGSGAGVAARFFAAALGSDTGGSIRLPASICGVTGIKGTQTRVPRTGVMPLSFSMDNVGPLTRTARDSARIMGVISGKDPLDPTSAPEPVPDYEAALTDDLRGLSVAVPREWFFESADPIVVATFEAALEVLKSRGATVTRVSCSSLRAIGTYVAVVSRVEAATIHANWMREHPGDYSVHLSGRLYGGYAIPGTHYLEALSRRGPLLRQFCAEAFAGHHIVATPTLRMRVPTLAETDIDADPEANWARHMAVSANTRPFNYLGLPTVSIPCGFDDRGLPVGMQITARPFAEARALMVADAFQRDTDWHARVPAL
ncbi:amidase [Neoroseomonas oryzicola]|uniref:Amidase n=1 Tax=Neoroseomonas oryzicola TaxID=535904 RepID=A0A9X9WLF6_9PROT|nr:amidase [Neoroseomonas oryzicola]MBR0661166.1 amidase [Neoroseomonas oryzicola]NKE15853.1 amidase [Neoroseomonas oryzicola]